MTALAQAQEHARLALAAGTSGQVATARGLLHEAVVGLRDVRSAARLVNDGSVIAQARRLTAACSALAAWLDELEAVAA